MEKSLFDQRYSTYRQAVETYLSGLFSEKPHWADLYESMRYSLLAGGKRIRPVMTLEFARLAGLETWQTALPVGCALELVHTYSLIHDDLPCMDDDDLRRGKPTNHVVFGYANAVLAGDALQTAAFETVLTSDFPAEVRAQAALELARGAGRDGMCAGQVLDMEGEQRPLSLEELRLVHRKKTGALLEAACVMGVIAAQGSREMLTAARTYAAGIGLAFQIRDDLLDHFSTTEELGKPVGSDEANHKTTFYTLLGKERCEELIRESTEQAKEAIRPAFSDSEFLCAMADWLAQRNH